MANKKEQLKNEMKLRLPSLSVNEGVARATVAAFCAQLDPSSSDLADIKCVVSEAVTNCIVHAYKDKIGDISVVCELYEENIVKIKIRDRGCGIADVKQAMEPLFTTGGEERAGLGFAVMESFMDKIKVSSAINRGTTVTMEKKISSR